MLNVKFLVKLILVGVLIFASFGGYSQSMARMNKTKKRDSGNGNCNICDLFEEYEFLFKLTPKQFPVKVESFYMTNIESYNSSSPSSKTYKSSFFPINFLISPNTNNPVPNQIIYSNSNLIFSSGYINFSTALSARACNNTSLTETNLSPEPNNFPGANGPFASNPSNTYKFRIHLIYSYFDSNTQTVVETLKESFDFYLDAPYECPIISSNSQSTSFAKISSTLLNKKSSHSEFLVDVSPNPFNRNISINVSSFPSDDEACDISLYNIQGHKIGIPFNSEIKFKKGNRIDLNLDFLPNGLYYLKVSLQKNSMEKVFKVIKN